VSLRHALLALVEVQPMTGYELAKHFDDSVSSVWHASHSQIYPELKRLEEEGLVQAVSATRGLRGKKLTYSITAAGCQDLQRWLEDVQAPVRERNAAYLKATYLEYSSFDAARRQFEEHLVHYQRLEQQWLAHSEDLRRQNTALMKERLRRAPESAHDAIISYKTHVYSGLIARARVEAEWAQRGLELVESLRTEIGEDWEARLSSPRPPSPETENSSERHDSGARADPPAGAEQPPAPRDGEQLPSARPQA
jgi:PadR family transcriptional regulator AphA